MKKLTIKSRSKNYTVFFKRDLKFLTELKQSNGIWIIDRLVYNFYRRYFKDIAPSRLILFRAEERAKTLSSAINIYRRLIRLKSRRQTPLISVGGGITQDVSGFVASTWYRGVPWVYIPTTLLAQTDSCIGSKTSLNFDYYKNILGTFYAPDKIFISPVFLESLSERDWHSGFGEIVKLQLIKEAKGKALPVVARRLDIRQGSAQLLPLVAGSLLVKKKYIETDEFDQGGRRLLNYGHCFGHALESVSQFAIPHGLAVVAGMLFANIIAHRRQYIKPVPFTQLVKLILKPHLRRELLSLKKEFFDPSRILTRLQQDKKRTGRGLALVLPRREWQLTVIQDLTPEEVKYGCAELKKIIYA